MARVIIWRHALVCGFLLALSIGGGAQSPPSEPLSIARQGYLFAGGKYATLGRRRVMTGHLYAEFQIPARQTQRWPIVMVHGGAQSGTNFTGTPDGREGWAQYFLRRGYAVYVVDQPGRGRAAYEAETYGRLTQLDTDGTERRFVAPERFQLWPQAKLHTQWPGTGAPGDAAFDQFFASQMPSIQDYALQQSLNRDALVALLEKIGPAILLTHSQSGAFGWPVADARPELVKAIVAVEPNGPPFVGVENVPAPEWFRDGSTSANVWGITAVPLAYVPPAATSSDLSSARQEQSDGPDLVRCWLQASPARQLPSLAKTPILVLTAEASYHAPYDHCTVKFLEQAGVRPRWVKLADVGIRGNGHMMMLEKNNAEIARVIEEWLGRTTVPILGGMADAFPAESGSIEITPIIHSSVQIEYAGTVIQVDPWSAGDLSRAKPADLILVTDDVGHHLDAKAIQRLRKPGAPVIVAANGKAQVPDGTVLANGQSIVAAGVRVEAVAAYDITPGAPEHPKGEANGYVMTLGGRRLYFAGVTECVPELKGLKNIDVAFMPMNIPPERMTPGEAAACVKALNPSVVYVYHYDQDFASRAADAKAVLRGLPGGKSVAQTLDEFRKAMAGSPIEVRSGRWYP